MIAVCPNPYRDIDLKLTRKTVSMLQEAGFSCRVCPVFAEPRDEVLPADMETCLLSSLCEGLRMVIVIGGDGTILAVTRELADLSVPILGVNLGTMGFMASLELDQLGKIVDAARGEYRISHRMLVDVTLQRDGAILYSGTALNDAVIHGSGDTISLNVSCDGTRVTTFSGDGIVVSTPTGSTGYSMSAGGPIVEPEASNIILSPICAHSICAKSFVLSDERTVTVSAEKLHDRKAFLSVDGMMSADILKGDVLTVRKSSRSVHIADMGVKSFYETTFEKLT